MSVLTIYNHGTGGSRKKDSGKREIVNIFGNHAQGIEGTDFIITEGVGKMGGPHKQLTVQTTTATGTSIGTVATTPAKARVDEALSAAVKGSGGAEWALRKMGEDKIIQASGIGVDENVASVLNMLVAMARAKRLPTVVNMMGWSRGAVTCIRIAHFMNKMSEAGLDRIPVNIFAVDPVAGEGANEQVDARTVGSNVRNYVATLAVHENRGGFSPMELNRMTFASSVAVSVLPMPGIHSDTAKYESATGKLTFSLCYRFLEHHGTVMHNALRAIYPLNDTSSLAEYDKLLKGKKASGIKEDQGFKARFMGGKVRREVHAVFTAAGTFFVNAHHKALFRTKFPISYQAYFGGGAGNRKTNAWLNEYRRQLFEDARLMGPGHKAALEALPKELPAPSPYLVDRYGYTLVNNGLFDGA
jgi:hypothetical protein